MKTDSPNGLTNHQLLLEIRSDLKDHIKTHDQTHEKIEHDLRARPTRTEVYQLLAGAGVISGIIFGIVNLTGG